MYQVSAAIQEAKGRLSHATG
jgi:hypothetical protein